MQTASNHLNFLKLLQLADSALPVGTAAHSFGLETLAVEGAITTPGLALFLRDYLSEIGRLEGAFCRAAYRLTSAEAAFTEKWLDLNQKLSALKPARESRAASATLGRRFAQLSLGLGGWPLLQTALESLRQADSDLHHCAAFGLVGGLLELDEEIVVLAYLQQSLTGLISACQRLLPLGQHQASQISWQLKPDLTEAADQGRFENQEFNSLACFTPLIDVGGMRHPTLTTRLFIS